MATDQRAAQKGPVMELPPYDSTATCPKCRHDDVRTSYQADTSHHGCPIGRAMETSYGPEHFVRTCQRCHYSWEEATLGEEVPRYPGARQPTEETGEAEVFINTLRFVVAPGRYTGRDVRRFMHPPLTDEHDLYLKGQNEDRQLTDTNTVTVRDGTEFFSAPKIINAGAR